MRRIVILGGVLSMCVALAVGRSPRDYYAADSKEGGFKGQIKLEIGQTGETPGRDVWTIKPTGDWTHTRAGEKEPRATGKLNEAEMKRLAVVFSAMRFNALPKRIGLPAEDLVGEETRHFVSLTFGTKRTVMIAKTADLSDALPPLSWGGEKLPEKDPRPKDGDVKELEPVVGHEEWARFVALTQVLKDSLKSGLPPKRAEREGILKEKGGGFFLKEKGSRRSGDPS